MSKLKLINLVAIVAGTILVLNCSGDDTVNPNPDAGTGGASTGSGGNDQGGSAGMTPGTSGSMAGTGGSAAGTGGAGGADCEPLTACGSECVDTNTTQEHCGACDRACNTANSSSTECMDGTCEPTCMAGFADCNVDSGTGADDGCETNLNLTDTCGTTCENAVACDTGEVCVDGVCSATCPDTVCGTECINLASTTAHCGMCDRACSSANTTSLACVGGTCAPICAAGFGDCTVDDGTGADDGCETDFNDVATCGTVCGSTVACETDQICMGGICVPDCAAMSLTLCGLECVDTTTDLAQCGACDHACSSANASSVECNAGVCEPTCDEGFGDCNMGEVTGEDDGCEADFADPATCGTSCEDAVACRPGEDCTESTCECNFTDCGDACADLNTSPDHCGACDRPCDAYGTSARGCTDGTCTPTCALGFADCNMDDGVSDDGCETFLSGQTTCGTVCDTGGAGGAGGAGGEAGTTVACTAPDVCNAGSCGTAEGVVRVNVPLTAAGQGQRYNILHQTVPVNLAGANVVIRAYAPDAINAQLRIVVRNNVTPITANPLLVPISELNDGFTDIVVPVPPAGDNFNPTTVELVSVEVEAPTDNTGPWQTPETIIYFDSVISSNGVINDTFATNPLNVLFQQSGARPLTGSMMTFLATFPVEPQPR